MYKRINSFTNKKKMKLNSNIVSVLFYSITVHENIKIPLNQVTHDKTLKLAYFLHLVLKSFSLIAVSIGSFGN